MTLGGENQQIIDRIQELKGELGSNDDSTKSGLYLDIKNKDNEVQGAKTDHQNKVRDLDKKLSDKATRGSESIKDNHERFGEIRYDKRNLEADISKVLSNNYQQLTRTQIELFESIIQQRELSAPPELSPYNLNFESLIQSTTDILKTVVGGSNKIEELQNDPSLNSWVQTGHSLHEERTHCAFCTNQISAKRRQELAQHFDQETQNLQSRIIKGLEHLANLIDGENFKINFDISQYYTQYHTKLSSLKAELTIALGKQRASLEQLKALLKQKNERLFTELEAEYPQDHSLEIENTIKEIEVIRTQCIQQNDLLENKQKEAKKALRLNHIYHFLQDINYTQLKIEIDLAYQAIAPLEMELTVLQNRETEIKADIKSEEDKLKSEGEACNRIKNILNHDFGHQALSLEPIEINTTNGKEIKFEIQRNGTKAHNLSEGEQSLISFCYFLAKIQDDLDQGNRPIIWIDDPICSLDSNHIYFIYALIENICLNNNFSQLFISTHNLDFLKYLTQLTPMGRTDHTPKRERAFYQIEKTFLGSTIKKMAYHLEQNSSEFIYLFEFIYKCSLATEINDSNHIYFYNFANNARKFLEIYTYYLFPNPVLKDRQRLQKFWGDKLPRIFSERINHDGSHAVTILEGKITLRNFSEININARLILSKLNESNTEQYNSLLESIGVSIT